MSKTIWPIRPGKRFGRLTVIEQAPNDRKGYKYFMCQCDCGEQKTVSSNNLRNGGTVSCGCKRRKVQLPC